MTAVIANALAQPGYEISILSLWGEVCKFPLNAPVRHHSLFAQRPSFKLAFLSTVRGIRNFVRRNAIDVLVDVDTMLAVFTLPATAGLNVRRIAWEHCHLHEDLGRPLRRIARHIAARTSDALVVLTERDRQQWLHHMSPRAHVVAIANPLPFPYPLASAPRGSKIVLAAGRLTAAKGFDILIRAWASVSPIFPDWRLRILGDGEERAALMRLVSELELSSTVSLPGMQLDMVSAYQNASVFCLSSHYEGFALVLLEAMAFGLPIVASDCETGPRELIRDGENGLLVQAGDACALADGLIRIIRDGALAHTLGETGRTVAKQYSLDRIRNAWIELLTSRMSQEQFSARPAPASDFNNKPAKASAAPTNRPPARKNTFRG